MKTNRTNPARANKHYSLSDIDKIIEYNEEYHFGLPNDELKTIDESEVDDYLKWYNLNKWKL